MFDEKYPEVDPNKKTAKDRWEAHYAGEGYLFGKEPVALLKSHLGALRKGKALDVGMGEGRNAVYLAAHGFQVQGVEIAPSALKKAGKLAEEKKVTVDIKPQNLDFYLMPLMGFDTIVMTYFRPVSRFFSELRRGLAVGGTLLIEAHTVEHFKTQNPPNPYLEFEDCFKPNELLHNLKDLQILYYKEMPEGNSHLVQLIAKKVNK